MKLLWVLGAAAAVVIGAYAAFEILFTSGLGGGSTGLAKALGGLSALLIVGLTATYGRVFPDTWPD